MKLLTLSFLTIFSMMVANNLQAQQQVIDIWEQKPPNSKQNNNYKLIEDTTGTWAFMRHVKHPKLDVYLAKASTKPSSAVIICPGGGYWGLAFKHEGEAVAKWLNKLGVSAFVLKYRLPDTSIMQNKTIGPLQDAQEAMRIVRRKAKAWNINPTKIGIMGFSAGGHLAASLSSHYNDNIYETGDSTSARPDFSILIYPVISMNAAITHQGSKDNLLGDNPTDELVKKYSNELQVNAQTPPAFLVHSIDDGAVPVQNSINYVLALKEASVKGELHLYQSGGHGYGLGQTNNTESSWPESCHKWLASMQLL